MEHYEKLLGSTQLVTCNQNLPGLRHDILYCNCAVQRLSSLGCNFKLAQRRACTTQHFPQLLWHGFRRYFGAKTRRANC
eukprot:1147396-Pelagomonas_calceolata.AAC.1